jgi:hypothetical protein
MIESILVVISGFALIWIVKTSRKANSDISKLSDDEFEEYKQTVNSDPRKYFIAGGSATPIPWWVTSFVVLVFIGALVYAVSNVS